MANDETSDSSEEFFDAEDITPRISKKRSPKQQHDNDSGFEFPESEEERNRDKQKLSEQVKQSQHQLTQNQNEFKFVEPKISGRQRFEEVRRCMQNDEDENQGNTPDSQNSSIDGVFPSARSTATHPFRIIENDTMSMHSMTSLGRVGRILSGSVDPSAISVGRDSNPLSSSSSIAQLQQQQVSGVSTSVSGGLSNSSKNSDSKDDIKDNTSSKSENIDYSVTKLQEPDVIASAKLAHSKTTDNLISSGPVRPPRRRKKLEKSATANILVTPLTVSLPSTMDKSDNNANIAAIPSPNTLEHITREIENSFEEAAAAAVAATTASTTTLTASMSGAGTSASGTDRKPILGGSLSRIPHSLGDSSTSVNSSVKRSPSNSIKSNSAPSRVSSIDPNQGLNIYKATRGRYVVKPLDDDNNKAEGPNPNEQVEWSPSFTNVRMSLAGTGTNSLGSGTTKYNSEILKKAANSRERRRSAGDEDYLKQLNIYVRTRTGSGKRLTDMEILEQVPVKNLDTGENFPLSAVEEKLPQCINPLSLHIMRLTSYLPESDEESVGPPPYSRTEVGDDYDLDNDLDNEEEPGRLRKKTAQFKRFIRSTARKTVDKAKSIASEVSHARHKEDVADIEDVVNPEQYIKIKASSGNKGPYEFAKLQHVQDLSGEHTGAVWCMKFSSCGRLLATAGQDRVLRIWVLKDAYQFFLDMRTKYNADQKSSPTPSQESLVSHHSAEEASSILAAAEKSPGPFMPKSFCTYTGHTSDLLDVSWSKNYFVLSSSMDKTVRLWHISRKECLCCFQHIDFVTAIAFHPRDDRYFLSGSLDGKLRLWNIPDKKVAVWNEVDGQIKLITAANFCQNGKFAVVGSYDGRCLFYNTDQLKYHTQIHVRSTRGKNATGRKISGIEPMPGEDKILVTSNDSRIRLYDLRDLNLSCKYKGYLNVSSQIKGSFSHDGKYIISGSENQCIYIWKTHHDYAKLSSGRRDRSDFWEGIKAHNAVVTCAIFAPHPEAIIKPDVEDELSQDNVSTHGHPDPLVEQRKKGCGGYVLVSADFNGCIKVFINKTKPKHSSLPYTAILD